MVVSVEIPFPVLPDESLASALKNFVRGHDVEAEVLLSEGGAYGLYMARVSGDDRDVNLLLAEHGYED